MHHKLHGSLIGGIFAIIVLGPQPIQAQYTADYQANIISGVASNWSGDYLVGSNTFADVLLIFDGGVLSNGYGYVGYEVSSSNNDVLVIGPGSVWKNFTDLSIPVDGNDLVVGNLGAGNSLVIGDGGKIVSGDGYLGYSSGSSNNSVLVTGPGSVWMNVSDVSVGWDGSRNSLVVSDGAFVSGYSSELGVDSNSGNNSALVTGSGSAWSNTFAMYVGSSGAGNSLVISNGGKMSSAYFVIGGWSDSSSNNSVLVTGPGSVVSYTTIGDAVGEIYVGSSGAGNSLVISDGGQVFNTFASVGYYPGSSNNNVVVADTNSLWSSDRDLFIGGSEWSYDEDAGAGNTMVIRNGGEVVDSSGFIGGSPSSSGNSVLVTGSGSVWSNNNNLYVGSLGAGNGLVISEGGQVASGGATVGDDGNSSGNSVLITDPGSVWDAGYWLDIGSSGAGNSLVISNGGELIDVIGRMGGGSSSSNNCVLVTDTSSVWSNRGGLTVGWDGGGNSVVISNGGQMFSFPGGDYYDYLGGESSGNRVLVTGPGSVWTSSGGMVFIGYGGGSNSVVINNAGELISSGIWVGAWDGSTSNSLLVTDTGSVWSNSGAVYVGWNGTANSLVISNGAQGVNRNAYVGGWGADNNSVVVTGPGSTWNNSADLYVGWYGVGDSLAIDDGGQVADDFGYVGYDSGSSENSVWVGAGAVWWNNVLHIGEMGSANSLVVDGGSVLATDVVIGVQQASSVEVAQSVSRQPSASLGDNSPGCDNLVQLNSGSVIVTNATHDAVLEVRNGQLILNGGVLQVDRLVMTNACGLFIRNGGTLIVGSVVLDPNLSAVGDGIPNGWKQQYGLDPLDPNVASEDPDGDGMSNLQEFLAGSNPVADIKTITREGNDIRVTWQAAAAKTNALQRFVGGNGGSYSNNFVDIFVVTDAVGGLRNYLDMGAVTNFPAGYYRVRLAP
ncbi:MAG: hypothetical protein ABSH14_00555 [Verrucomicrobiia bacterium]